MALRARSEPEPRRAPTLGLDAIPPELKAPDQWVVWRKLRRHGKSTKVPFQSLLPPAEASTTDPATWSTFEEAASAASDPGNRLDGIGFVFAPDDGLAGVDLDNCLDEAGSPRPWAAAILAQLPGYAEVSPSGLGIKLFVRGEVPGGKGRKLQKLGEDGAGAIECYDRGRYFTVTGRVLAGHERVVDASRQLAELHAGWFPEKAKPGRRPDGPAPRLDDAQVVARARSARNGGAFEALFGGSTEGYPSKSEADLALCSKISWWVGGDHHAIDRIFRASGLCDEKWTGRADYREATIAKAANRPSFYDPGKSRSFSRLDRGRDGGGGDGGGPGGDGDGNGDGSREAMDDPHRLARVYLRSACHHADGLTLRYWNEEWHRWDGHAWRVAPDREVVAELTGAIKDEFDRAARGNGDAPKPVTTKTVSNVSQALRHLALLKTREVWKQPSWLGPFEAGEDLPDPAEVLPAVNGLVHLPSFAAGEPCAVRPTPRLFSPNCLGYAFDAVARQPGAWLGFLGGLWPDDPESVASLQEWFGYLLVPDTGQQKILMLIGPKRSGKGTIGRVLRALVGPENVAAPTLSGMATQFGLAPLIGKPVALIADARLSGRADTQVIVERLLSISGEDAQTIDRKHLSSWTGPLPTRFVLVSNELPRLGDASGALPSRMIVLKLTRSFFGREDTTLTDRLLMERPAILLWAIAGWVRLRERGYFLQPRSGQDLLEDLDELASPVGTFIAERCETGPQCEVDVKSLFAAWRQWCEENGRDHPGDVAGFGRQIRAVLPGLKTHQPRRDGGRMRVFQGIELRVVPPY